MQDSGSVIQQFQQLEEDSCFLDAQVDGFCPWAYVRFSVYMRIEEILNAQEKRVAKGTAWNAKNFFQFLMHCTIQNPRLIAKRADYLFITHARRMQDGGRFKCIYTDDLAKLHEKDGVSAEFLFLNHHFLPATTPHLLFFDAVDVIPAIFYPLKRKIYARQIAELKSICDKIQASLEEAFQVELGKDYLSQMVEKRFVWHHEKKRMLGKILDRIQPKVIVEVVGYETNKMILNELAKERGIPTIELQHGVIGRGHLAYNYFKKREYTFTPDYLFLFSDYWKNTASFPQADDHLIVTGYPYMERMRGIYPPKEKDIPMRDRTVVVLVISQPEYSKKLLRDVSSMVKKLLDSNLDVQINYKLHPAEFSMDNSEYEALETTGKVRVIKDTSVNLYSLFRDADIQVGVTSTAIFEGLAYDLKTFLLHYEKTDAYMGDLCQQQYATMGEDGSEVADKIIQYVSEAGAKADVEGPSIFFKENALQCIDDEMKKIMVMGK